MPFIGMLKCSKCGDRRADGDQGREGVSLDSLCVYVDCDGTYQDED